MKLVVVVICLELCDLILPVGVKDVAILSRQTLVDLGFLSTTSHNERE